MQTTQIQKAISSLQEHIVRYFSKHKTVLIGALSLNIFSFFLFISHHFMHNHGARLPWVSSSDQLHAGRWFAGCIFFLFGNANTPVLLPISSMLMIILSANNALTLWNCNFPNKKLRTALVSMLSIYPAMLSIYYYNWQPTMFASALLLATLTTFALFSAKWYVAFPLGAILTMLTLATYQPAFSVIFVIIFGRYLIALYLSDYNTAQHSSFTHFARSIFTVLVGGLLYKWSLILFHINPAVQTTTLTLPQLSERFFTIISMCFDSLIITQPEIRALVKNLLLFICCLGSMGVIYRAYLLQKWRGASIASILIILLVLSTKAMFFVSASIDYHNYRYNFALGFFYVAMALITYLSWKSPLVRTGLLTIYVVIILNFSQADLIRQLILMRGQQHDLAIANRILQRIESLPDLDLTKEYVLIRIGNYSNFRESLLASDGMRYDIYGDDHMDKGELTAEWAPAEVMRLLGTKIKFKFFGYTPNFLELINDTVANLIGNRRPWPAPDSIFVQDDRIVVIMENPNLEKK